MKLPVVHLPGGQLARWYLPGKAKRVTALGPAEWLWFMHHAEYVVTNSFYATVFAAMYHKKFFTLVHGAKNGGINVRMNDFLNKMGLSDRILSEVPETIDTGMPDFSGADRTMEEMRKESMDYLRSNLEAAYKQKLEFEK